MNDESRTFERLKFIKNIKSNNPDDYGAFEGIFNVLSQENENLRRFGVHPYMLRVNGPRYPITYRDPISEIQRFFSGLEQTDNRQTDLQNYLTTLNERHNALQKKTTYLDKINNNLVLYHQDFKARMWSPLIGLDDSQLEKITKGLSNVATPTLETYMSRYSEMAQAIARGGKYNEDELMEDLMQSLSRFNEGSIEDNFNAAFDALCKKYEEGRGKNQGLGGFFNQLFGGSNVKQIDETVLINPFAAETLDGVENQQSTAEAEAAAEAEAPEAAAPAATAAAAAAESTSFRPRGPFEQITSFALACTKPFREAVLLLQNSGNKTR